MYSELVSDFEKQPRDICTVPLNRRKHRWFYVFVKDGRIYVDSAKNHSNSSSLSSVRQLNENEYSTILDIYHRRQNGEHVSQEASEVTQNKVYWYGIFSDLNL